MKISCKDIKIGANVGPFYWGYSGWSSPGDILKTIGLGRGCVVDSIHRFRVNNLGKLTCALVSPNPGNLESRDFPGGELWKKGAPYNLEIQIVAL